MELIDKFHPQILETTPEQTSDQQKKASYVVALALARQCRPITDGIFFKEVAKSVLECFGEKGREFASIVDDIPLSFTTIVRRTEKIASLMFEEVKTKVQKSKYFALGLDDTTDMNSVSQLIIYVRTIDENFDIQEDMLALVAMTGHVTGKTLYKAVEDRVFSWADRSKLSSTCTDGAKVMLGEGEGFLGQLRKNGINVPHTHCIIHQQVLASKILSNLPTLHIATKIINKLKGGHNALNHRKLKEFLAETDAEHGDLVLHTEVRWLSRGKSLQRLYELRNDIVDFLRQENLKGSDEILGYLQNTDFLADLAYLCDLTLYLNQFNLNLQGRNKSIVELVNNVDEFKRRLALLAEQFQQKNFSNFPKAMEAYKNVQNQDIIIKHCEILETLIKNFEKQFEGFSEVRNFIKLYEYPRTCNISEQPIEIQNELSVLQADLMVPIEKGLCFWKQLDEKKYPKTKEAGYKLLSMFGSTYLCESSFSFFKLIQTRIRNRTTNQHLENLLRIKCYDREIDLEFLLKGK